MVLCKACDKYLKLLNDGNDAHLGQSDHDNDQDDNFFCKELHSAKEIMDGMVNHPQLI